MPPRRGRTLPGSHLCLGADQQHPRRRFPERPGRCIVVDIGGTTTDVGVLAGGLPRESSIAVDVGGVRTNFRMPDVLSIGLGGGSRVRQDGGSISVGPDSVGFKLRSEGLVFGGSTLTATDIAVAGGHARSIGNGAAVRHLEARLGRCRYSSSMRAMIEDAIDRMKTSASAVPVVLVGGGSILAPTKLRGASEVIIPKHAGVANAIGAAIAQGRRRSRPGLFRMNTLGRDDSARAAPAPMPSSKARRGRRGRGPPYGSLMSKSCRCSTCRAARCAFESRQSASSPGWELEHAHRNVRHAAISPAARPFSAPAAAAIPTSAVCCWNRRCA